MRSGEEEDGGTEARREGGIAQMLQTEGGRAGAERALQREKVEMRAPPPRSLPAWAGREGASERARGNADKGPMPALPRCFINAPSITQEIPQLPACLPACLPDRPPPFFLPASPIHRHDHGGQEGGEREAAGEMERHLFPVQLAPEKERPTADPHASSIRPPAASLPSFFPRSLIASPPPSSLFLHPT